MRKVVQKIIFSLLFSPQIWGDNFLEDTRKRIQKLISERENIINLQIPDPFFREKNTTENIILKIPKVEIKREKKLKLETIFNERAKISGEWFSLHQFCNDYKISKIGKDFVKLVRDDEVKILKFPKKHKLLNSE
ncbi:hypothetical protein ThvES_00007290 [Thiovulum sp. ES]|nr:hypothetical protein ThvES_00007290 [Thiovulum sp. ES]